MTTAAPERRKSGPERAAWLERWIVAYERGLLVPFIGAGMSVDVCRLWGGFVDELERRAGLPRPAGDGDPVQRAARAVQRLRFGSREGVADGVSAALLARGPGKPPPQTEALASIFWPLVVTTNYDDLYLAAAHEAHLRSRERLNREERTDAPLLLLGRSQRDCQRILTSLRQPDVPILWALQGFIGGQAQALPSQQEDGGARALYRDHARLADRARLERLRRELVVGHAEYRRVAMASEPFRRAFAELYRSRSLLFLGSGLRDKYFLDLFNEIIELYGPSPHAHYALLEGGKSDLDFLQQYFGIWVCEIEYAELPGLLGQLAEGISGSRPRQMIWQFTEAPSIGPHAMSSDRPGLRIVRGDLPGRPAEDQCLAFSSGGRSGRLDLSGVAKRILEENGLPSDASAFEPAPGASGRKLPLWRHRDDPRFLAVNARLDPWTEDGLRIRPADPTRTTRVQERPTTGGRMRRDIRIVPLAVQELMQAAQALGHRRVDTMLLAAGPLRTFPQSHALMQMVRGWASGRGAATGSRPSLSIYLIARDVLYDLDAGRLDLTRNLTPDVVEFWLEIVKQDGEIERYLHVGRTDSALRDVLARFDIERPEWRLDLTPHPCLGWANWDLAGVRRWERRFGDLTLETFGILPGSTLQAVEPS
jgi:SIR2-like domain